MSMYDLFKTDQELEKLGAVLDYGDFRVVVARAGGANKDYVKHLTQLSKPYKRAMQLGTMNDEKAEDLVKMTYASKIVKGWETKVDGGWQPGIADPNSETELLPVTPENVLKMFEFIPLLYEDIVAQSNEMANFRRGQLETEAKN